MKLDVIIEKGKKEFWGRIEGYDFLPVTVGKDISEIVDNLKMLIADYIEHEGHEDKVWKEVNVNEIAFTIHLDLRAFFDRYDFLNTTKIASKAKINSSLLRQYINGHKYPTTKQAKKVETAVHELAKEMVNVSLVGSTI